ncbi:MAG: hypothetical protein IPM54_44220 [Polyangiaceae bacterium]|nr:hypothetical protein [Polyangiaceae bacterium]
MLLGMWTAAWIVSACGTGERTADTSDAAGGSGGGGTGGGATGGGGSAGGGGNADAGGLMDAGDGDSGDPDAGTGPCVDIHILPSMLPEPEKWYGIGPTIGVSADRDHIWRDANGLHVAWNPVPADASGPVLVVSSFDPATGAVLKHRFFPDGGRKVVNSTSLGPDNTVGLAVGWVPPDGGAGGHALLVFSTSDSSEALYPLPPWPEPGEYSLVGVGWDGEAFAVHAWKQNVQYVTRIQPDGTVLLPPTAFGKAYGYVSEIRYATDTVSGVTVAVSGFSANFPWLTGHLRDGTPVPDPAKIQGIQLEPQNWLGVDGGWAGGTTRPAIAAIAGGAGVAWSSGSALSPITTFVQGLGASLETTANAIGFPGEAIPSPGPGQPKQYTGMNWLTVQQRAGGGWWVAGNDSNAIIEHIADGPGNLQRRALVTFSKAPQWGFAVTDFESTHGNDELWLAFMDRSSSEEVPFRVIRAHPACTYSSMYDLIGQ